MEILVEKEDAEVLDICKDGQCVKAKLLEVLPEDLVEYITDSIKPPVVEDRIDRP